MNKFEDFVPLGRSPQGSALFKWLRERNCTMVKQVVVEAQAMTIVTDYRADTPRLKVKLEALMDLLFLYPGTWDVTAGKFTVRGPGGTPREIYGLRMRKNHTE